MSSSSRPVRTLRSQLPALRSALLLAWVPAAVVLGTLVVLQLSRGIAARVFLLDPVGAAGAPWYYGSVSHLGAVTWAAGGAVALYAANQRRRAGTIDGLTGFLGSMGGFTLVLALDDLLLLHEGFFRYILGLRELLIFGAYAAIMMALLVHFRRLILGTDYLLLTAALAMFTVSVVLTRRSGSAHGRHLVEDGSKFAGILTWTVYLVRLSLASSPAPAPAVAEPSARRERSQIDSAYPL